MHYLFASNPTPDKLPISFSWSRPREMLSLQEPWASGRHCSRASTIRRGSMRSNR